MKKIAVIMGSASDMPVVEKAINTLKEYEIPYEVHVFSAHRTPEACAEFVLGLDEVGGEILGTEAGVESQRLQALTADDGVGAQAVGAAVEALRAHAAQMGRVGLHHVDSAFLAGAAHDQEHPFVKKIASIISHL